MYVPEKRKKNKNLISFEYAPENTREIFDKSAGTVNNGSSLLISMMLINFINTKTLYLVSALQRTYSIVGRACT